MTFSLLRTLSEYLHQTLSGSHTISYSSHVQRHDFEKAGVVDVDKSRHSSVEIVEQHKDEAETTTKNRMQGM